MLALVSQVNKSNIRWNLLHIQSFTDNFRIRIPFFIQLWRGGWLDFLILKGKHVNNNKKNNALKSNAGDPIKHDLQGHWNRKHYSLGKL